MTAKSLVIAGSTALAFFVGSTATSSATEASKVDHDKAQITILYDAFRKDPAMQKDWGYAALVEYGGIGDRYLYAGVGRTVELASGSPK